MKKSIPIILSLFALSCTTMEPKPEIMHVGSIATVQKQKVIVFPVTNFEGVVTPGLEEMDRLVKEKWAQLYGEVNMIYIKEDLDLFLDQAGKAGHIKLIRSLNNIDQLDRSSQDQNLITFLEKVKEKYGNQDLTFAVVDGERSSFEKNKPLQINLGRFDIKDLSWSWITKVQTSKSESGHWQTAYMKAFTNSFKVAEQLNQQKIEHSARKFAH